MIVTPGPTVSGVSVNVTRVLRKYGGDVARKATLSQCWAVRPHLKAVPIVKNVGGLILTLCVRDRGVTCLAPVGRIWLGTQNFWNAGLDQFG